MKFLMERWVPRKTKNLKDSAIVSSLPFGASSLAGSDAQLRMQ
jgi:hypothetical protein